MRRRLAKVFEVIDDDTDVYLVGYSRGMAVALELVSSLHEQRKSGQISPANATWFRRVRGVVGVGGVYYGANFARDVLTGKAAASELITLFSEASDKLRTIPDGVTRSKRRVILAKNLATWARFVKRISIPKTAEIAAHRHFLGITVLDAYMEEIKTHAKKLKLHAPNPWGIFLVVINFFLQTFDLKSLASRYNENILAFKQLVEAVVTGVRTLTPASRDEWWRNHELPNDLVFLSITGTMPDASLYGFRSPLLHFEGFGSKTSDYNSVLRTSYYGTVASENTQINDSQVSHFSSRYWEQMYPEHRYAHYYLGVLGTHHWGMAFRFGLKVAESGGNTFPRATLLKSIASFITSLDRDHGPSR